MVYWAEGFSWEEGRPKNEKIDLSKILEDSPLHGASKKDFLAKIPWAKEESEQIGNDMKRAEIELAEETGWGILSFLKKWWDEFIWATPWHTAPMGTNENYQAWEVELEDSSRPWDWENGIILWSNLSKTEESKSKSVLDNMYELEASDENTEAENFLNEWEELYNTERYREAAISFAKWADLWNAGAMFRLWEMYEKWEWVPADIDLTRELYQLAANQNNEQAIASLNRLKFPPTQEFSSRPWDWEIGVIRWSFLERTTQQTQQDSKETETEVTRSQVINTLSNLENKYILSDLVLSAENYNQVGIDYNSAVDLLQAYNFSNPNSKYPDTILSQIWEKIDTYNESLVQAEPIPEQTETVEEISRSDVREALSNLHTKYLANNTEITSANYNEVRNTFLNTVNIVEGYNKNNPDNEFPTTILFDLGRKLDAYNDPLVQAEVTSEQSESVDSSVQKSNNPADTDIYGSYDTSIEDSTWENNTIVPYIVDESWIWEFANKNDISQFDTENFTTIRSWNNVSSGETADEWFENNIEINQKWIELWELVKWQLEEISQTVYQFMQRVSNLESIEDIDSVFVDSTDLSDFVKSRIIPIAEKFENDVKSVSVEDLEADISRISDNSNIFIEAEFKKFSKNELQSILDKSELTSNEKETAKEIISEAYKSMLRKNVAVSIVAMKKIVELKGVTSIAKVSENEMANSEIQKIFETNPEMRTNRDWVFVSWGPSIYYFENKNEVFWKIWNQDENFYLNKRPNIDIAQEIVHVDDIGKFGVSFPELLETLNNSIKKTTSTEDWETVKSQEDNPEANIDESKTQEVNSENYIKIRGAVKHAIEEQYEDPKNISKAQMISFLGTLPEGYVLWQSNYKTKLWRQTTFTLMTIMELVMPENDLWSIDGIKWGAFDRNMLALQKKLWMDPNDTDTSKRADWVFGPGTKEILISYLENTEDLPNAVNLQSELDMYEKRAENLSQSDQFVLNKIAEAELPGWWDYNTPYGLIPGKPHGFWVTPNKPFTEMSIAEVFEYQKQSVAHQNVEIAAWRQDKIASSATWRYQIMQKTLRYIVEKYDIDIHEKFDKSMQDMLALLLLDWRWLDKLLARQMWDEEFLLELSKEWAAFPRDQSWLSYHDGDGTNTAQISYTNAMNFIQDLKQLA